MTQFLPQEPEQADSCGVRSPAKPSPVPSGPSKKHPHGQGFTVEMGNRGRQGFLPVCPPSEADRAHYKGWRVCSSLGTPYPLIQAATGRGRGLASMQGVKSCHSLQHCIKAWAGELVERGEQDSSCKPPSACSPLPLSSGGPQALLGLGVPGEYAVQDEGCNRDAQTEVWKKPSSCRPC